MDDPDFTEKEIDSVFRSANRGTALGTDDVPMEVAELLYSANKTLFQGLIKKF